MCAMLWVRSLANEALAWACNGRAITEMDADAPPELMTQLAEDDRGVRMGLIPAKYDSQRKRVTYYWFIGHGAHANVRSDHRPYVVCVLRLCCSLLVS